MPIISLAELSSVKIDCLIVGGGTAGLTLAARLTELPEITVLVVEAGNHHGPTPEIDIPGFMGRAIANPKFDWTFLSVPQARARDRVVLQPRGKGLGGSSLLNFLGMFRPSKEELDAIESLGNKGWNWESLLSYMKKSETTFKSGLSSADAQKLAANPDFSFHGTEGPICKSLPPFSIGIQSKFLDAAERLGLPRNPETSNGKNVGSMTSFGSIDPRDATRSYAAPAYLEPNVHRKNLLVLTDAQVTKILLETDENSLQKATGVEIVKDGSAHVIGGVTKDVIISAGSLQTPQILELSGIGNPEILSKYGIKVVVNLRGVGENLQDHVGVVCVLEVDAADDTIDVLADPMLAKKHEELYKEQRGLLTFQPAMSFAFLSGDILGTKEDISAWQTHGHTIFTESLAKVTAGLKTGLEKQYQIMQKLISDDGQAIAEIALVNGHLPVSYSAPAQGKRYASLFCILMHPLSRGSVHIASQDPLAPPAIDPNYFSNEADLDLIVHTVQFARSLCNTEPLSGCVKEVIGPSKVHADRGAEGLKDFIKDNCGPTYHPVGSAAMLGREDGGVVDESLKVHGTSNLRVVDLSILPLELSGHIQSIAYAIGEKAADILKSEYFRTR